MDRFEKEDNMYQSQNLIQNNSCKPTYLTTYQQFLSSRLGPPQIINTMETTKYDEPNKVVLLENMLIKKSQTQLPDCNQIESVEDLPMPKHNSSGQKETETYDNSLMEYLNLNPNRNNSLETSNISQDNPTSDVESVASHEPIEEFEDEPVTAYECKICSFETIYEDVFREHMLTHKKKETFHKCPKCNFKMKCKARFKKHMAVEEVDIVYCGLYSYSKECRGDLTLHLKVHKKDHGTQRVTKHSYLSS